MKLKEFEKNLTNNTLPSSFLFYGESHYLIEYYASKIINSRANKDETLSMYFDEYHFQSAKSHLQELSLFGDTNLLHIKTDKKIPKNELEILLEICKKNEGSFFIYSYLGDDTKTLFRNFTAKRDGDYLRIFNPNFYDAKNILKVYAQEMGLDIDDYAITYMLNAFNLDIALCINELEKLLLLERRITAKEIDTFTFSLAHVNVEECLMSLLQKKEIDQNIQKLIESDEDEIKIITNYSTLLNQLFLFNIHIKLHGNADSKEILGYKLPIHLEKQRASLAIKFRFEQYKKMLACLLESELYLKSQSNIDKKAYLTASLIKLQTFF